MLKYEKGKTSIILFIHILFLNYLLNLLFCPSRENIFYLSVMYILLHMLS